MAKIKKIRIIDAHTLELEENATIGDRIDLLDIDIKSVDTSRLNQLILDGRDSLYNQKIETEKLVIAEAIRREYEKQLETSSTTVVELRKDLVNERERVEVRLKLSHSEELQKLNLQIQKLQADNSHDSALLNGEILALKKDIDLRIENAVQDSYIKHQSAIAAKETEINRLQNENKQLILARSSKNTKRQGEELEVWCNNEFNTYTSAFLNCRWIKDTKSIEGDDGKSTKADYLLEIFGSDSFKADTLLSRVALEMKTEDPTSNPHNKSTNASHIKKLVQDMNKKGAEYGLLVSELEWNADNDPLVQKVQGEKNVYIVRPPYFVSFLSIINSLVLKYREITEQLNHEKIAFKNVIEINRDFEEMKNEILGNSVKNLEKNVEVLVKNNEVLRKTVNSNQEILDGALIKHLNTIKKKIGDFNIKKIAKQISDLDE